MNLKANRNYRKRLLFSNNTTLPPSWVLNCIPLSKVCQIQRSETKAIIIYWVSLRLWIKVVAQNVQPFFIPPFWINNVNMYKFRVLSSFSELYFDGWNHNGLLGIRCVWNFNAHFIYSHNLWDHLVVCVERRSHS